MLLRQPVAALATFGLERFHGVARLLEGAGYEPAYGVRLMPTSA